jgi:curli production assembly/transport component CsgG
MLKKLILFLGALALTGCAATAMNFDLQTQEVAYKELETITVPEGDPIVIAVYDFVDMTGQKKPGGNFASMSTAVTQGSYQLLIKALQDAGGGKWFRVVERHSLPSLLQERKLIRTTRQMADGDNAEALPALLFAGAYVTGGVVGYDSDIVSGGAGARILGIGTHKEYRQDVVSIILRLVNVQSGEVIITTTIEKTIFSTSTGADVFKYVDAGVMLLEVETGFAKNEPVTFAVRKAIEAGVVELIKQGVEKDLWKYKVIEEIEVTAEDLEVDEEVIEENIDLNEQIIWNEEKEFICTKIDCGDENINQKVIEELDELLNEEKTYQEYLIEKDAGIHESKEETTIECLPSGDCYDPNWVPVYEEESTNEQNNETSAIVPTVHAS